MPEFDLNTLGLLSQIASDYVGLTLPERLLGTGTNPHEVTLEHFAHKQSFPIAQRELLVDCLSKDYDFIPLAERDESKVWQNIQSLLSPATFTVTTGQQIHIFLGPMYVPHKVFSMLKTVRNLNGIYHDKNIIPIFWMATEDHDLAEINHVTLWNKTFTWNAPEGGMVGDLACKSLTTLVDEMIDSFRLDESKLELLEVFKTHYAQSLTLAEATRKILHHFFEPYGVVVLDANKAQLKQSFAAVMTKELQDGFVYEAIQSQNNYLKEEGYVRQISPKDTALFFVDENGNRQRLDRVSATDFVLYPSGVQWVKTDLLKVLKSNPEKFSPNVAMRPLFQEMILPNLAYVGGAGEIAYWLQLPIVFEKAQIHFPSLLLRDTQIYIKQKTWSQWEALGLNHELLLLSEKLFEEQINALYIGGEKRLFFEQEFEKIMQSVADYTFELDASQVKHFKQTVKQWRNQLKNHFDGLQDKAKEKEMQNIQKLTKLRDQVYLNGVFQERKMPFLAYILDGNKLCHMELSLNRSSGYLCVKLV